MGVIDYLKHELSERGLNLLGPSTASVPKNDRQPKRSRKVVAVKGKRLNGDRIWRWLGRRLQRTPRARLRANVVTERQYPSRQNLPRDVDDRGRQRPLPHPTRFDKHGQRKRGRGWVFGFGGDDSER